MSETLISKAENKKVFVVFKKVWRSRLSFETQLKIEFLLPFSDSRKALKITLFIASVQGNRDFFQYSANRLLLGNRLGN